MTSAQGGDPLLVVTMSPAAAERFKQALYYASAVCQGKAEVNRASETKAKIEEHAEWLRWGAGRVIGAEVDAS